MKSQTRQFKTNANRELKNSTSRQFLSRLAPYFARSCAAAMKSFPDPAAAIEYGRAIRADVIARLPDLLRQFEENAEAHGAKIIWTKTAEEANRFILNLARQNRVSYVTKGKSMVTEEMGLNEFLQTGGIEVLETDLGEYIIQLMKRPPFHLVGPAINVPVEEICHLFLAKGLIDRPTMDRVELGGAARKYLRDKFRHVQMGITGVNMAVAETGAILNVENEGNIRMIKSSPRIQVSVMSLEKVVPTMADAMHMLRLLCRHCTAQKISSYVTMDCGPRKKDEIDGPEELYIIILDNGRSDIYQDIQSREALRCIRCGACLNVCPVYGKIGGYPYGWAYSGPMGQVLNPLLLGLEQTSDLYHATTLCGACRSVCPAGVDHPRLFLHYRTNQNTNKDIPYLRQGLIKLWGYLVRHNMSWTITLKAIRFLAKHNTGKNGFFKKVKGLDGWFVSRDLPAINGKTFRERWITLEKENGRPGKTKHP